VNLKPALWTCAALLAVAAAVGLYGYLELPAGAQVAVHIGFNGRPDGFAPKAVGVAIMPLASAAVLVLLTLLPKVAPGRAGLEASALPYGVGMVAVTLLLTICQISLVGLAIDPAFNVPRAIAFGFALLGLMLGNYLGKARRNHLFGVRTPWTLADERVWDKTHRFTGRLTFLGGLALLAVAVVSTSPLQLFVALVVCAIAPWLIGAAYSGLIFRRRADA
jgi:uncharacterized membrane protein